MPPPFTAGAGDGAGGGVTSGVLELSSVGGVVVPVSVGGVEVASVGGVEEASVGGVDNAFSGGASESKTVRVSA